MKLGPHCQGVSDAALRWARVAPIVKTIDSTAGLEVARPDAIRVYRKYVGDGNKDRAAVFNEILAGLKGYRHPNLYVEVVNEPSQWDADFIGFVRSLAVSLHEVGIKVCAPCWSTGTPEESIWQRWRAEGWAEMDAIAIHAYFGNEGFSPWHAMRFSRFWQPGDPPVIISECGRDAIEGGMGGWRRDGLSPERYAAELLSFDRLLSALPYVLGATPFTAAPTDARWDPFNTDPLVDLILAGQPAPVPQPAPGGTPVPDQSPEFIAALETKYGITHRDSATVYLAELIERSDPPNITADGPADAFIQIGTNDEAHHASGMGHVDMPFSHPAAYTPPERGFFYAVCEAARVDGLGWAFGIPGDTAPHRNVAVRFARRSATPPQPPTGPPQPPSPDQEIINGFAVSFGFLAAYRADKAGLGLPISPMVSSGQWMGEPNLADDKHRQIQFFQRATLYWTGSEVKRL